MPSWELAACLTLTLMAAADPKPPVEARLVAKTTTYALDRQGLTAEQYRAAIQVGKVAPLAVDVVLELKNVTPKPVRLRVGGMSPRLTFAFQGPARVQALLVPSKEGVWGGWASPPPRPVVTLKPGEVYRMAFSRLIDHPASGYDGHLFWVEPGEYTLAATLRTRLGEKEGDTAATRTGLTVLETPPIKLTVTTK